MRFVVKIGTNLLTQEDNALNTHFISEIAKCLSKLHEAGHEPVIVTSGAVAAGRKSIQLKKESKTIPYRQLLASIGQTYLLETYRDQFEKYGIFIGQVLLTRQDFDQHKSFLNTRNTLELMLKERVIPVVNENDVITFDELKLGDNDNLSARLSSMINAETLILLTDVEGLFDANPKTNPEAQFIEEVSHITPEIKKMAMGKHSTKSMGGMASKLQAAEYATQAGVNVWITTGSEPQVVSQLIENANPKPYRATLFKRQFTPREARRKWLQTQQNPNAILVVDEGAQEAIVKKGKSLLPSGIQRVDGTFKRGDVVSIMTKEGQKIGFGQVNYSSEEIERLQGNHSQEIETILGYRLEEEIVHRDNMVN